MFKKHTQIVFVITVERLSTGAVAEHLATLVIFVAGFSLWFQMEHTQSRVQAVFYHRSWMHISGKD